MQNVLFLAPIIEENRVTQSKNVLLNASRVTHFYTDSNDGYTVFHYNDITDRRDSVTVYKTSWVLWNFEQVFEETEPNPFITLNIDRYNPHCVGTKGPGRLIDWPYSENKININLDWFVKAEARPSGEVGSFVYTNSGAFKTQCFRSSDVLEVINSTSSNSGSLV